MISPRSLQHYQRVTDMSSWQVAFLACTALCFVGCHANTKTFGRTSPVPQPLPLPAPRDSGKACSCSGAVSRSLDCSNRGRSAFSAKDLCKGRTTSVNLSKNSFTAFPSTLGSYVVEVNISTNQLTTMPRAPPLNAKTTLLDVSNNRISQASDELRALSSLKSLRVNGNRLQTLSFLPEPCALERLAAHHNALRSLDGPLRSCSQMKSLDLSNNQMVSLSRGAFSGLKKLEELKLTSAGLLNLEGGSFEGLQELDILDLSSNSLVSLPSGIFSQLKELEILHLDDNKITNLPADVFTGLKNVKYISLKGNKLTNLPRGVFSNLKTLKFIIITDNMLRSLPDGIFSGLQKVEAIGLAANQLEILPNRLFAGLRSLRGISLSENRLTTLPQDTFSGITELEMIELHSNRMNSLPLGLFHGVKSVKILDLSRNLFTSPNFMSSLKSLKSIDRLDLIENKIEILPPYDSDLPDIKWTFFDNHKITDVMESTMRSWLNSGNKKRTLYLGTQPMLRSVTSLRWILSDKKVQTSVASNCKCGSLKREKAEINFCVDVPCPGSTASWVQALRASAPAPSKGH